MKMGITSRAAIALAGAFLAAGAIAGEGSAAAARSAVLAGHTVSGQAIPCVTQADGVRVCHGDGKAPGELDLRVMSFDGIPLALYVTLPPVSTAGAGHYPLVIMSHGWGDPTSGPDDTQYGGPTARQWAKEGYAVLQLVARGWGDSCGSLPSRFLDPAGCRNGYVHVADFRYEMRDAQYVAGLLVDEGIADPNRIGAQGESYGGGTSLELATLNDRVMNADGTLSPWTSPDGKRLHIAAAAPFASWSDLASAGAPNGRWLDWQKTAPNLSSPFGVQKMSIGRGLLSVGASGAYYPPPGADPDILMGFALGTAGEPYDRPQVQAMLRDDARFHSAYYLLAGTFGTPKEAPAPLLLAQGFTDDVFGAKQVLIYYNLLRSLYPHAPVELLFGDVGHQRAQDKPADLALMRNRIQAFFAHYVKGTGPQPGLGVTALTQTCPASAPSGGPYTARTWAALHPGVVVFRSRPTQTILSTAGNPAVSWALDPVYGGRSCTTVPATPEGPGVATYRLPSPTGSGYTLLGSPMVSADLQVTGQYAYIAARLLDVDPATNTATLVSRGVYRIAPNAAFGRRTFQLWANGWHFAPGHIPELELLGRDMPFLRPSNGQFSIAVSNLELRLPVHEAPGVHGTPSEVTRPVDAPRVN